MPFCVRESVCERESVCVCRVRVLCVCDKRNRVVNEHDAYPVCMCVCVCVCVCVHMCAGRGGRLLTTLLPTLLPIEEGAPRQMVHGLVLVVEKQLRRHHHKAYGIHHVHPALKKKTKE